jgi:lysine 2,3-aminomutase
VSTLSFTTSPPWHDVSPDDWNNWRWQLRHRIATLEQLEQRLTLTAAERAGTVLAGGKLALGITPHFFNLVDADDEHCPVRRQVVPRLEEVSYSPDEMSDPCGEDGDMVAPGLVRRYPDRVLFLVTDRCASYCRYCTRSRVVSGVGEQELETDFEEAFRYLETHAGVRDVLLSGGDPLLLSDGKLEGLLARLRGIRHIQLVRIGSRAPVFLPQRITPELCAMLRKYHPLWMSVHVNHPRELTVETREALGRLADAGIPLGNQSVLLKGVNNDGKVLLELCQKLLMCRVRPYYLYQCDLIRGSAHLRTSIQEGLELMNRLRGYTTGYAIPQYVVDGPGGGGKIPLNPNYIVAKTGDRFVLRNYKGEIYEYPEQSPEPAVLQHGRWKD